MVRKITSRNSSKCGNYWSVNKNGGFEPVKLTKKYLLKVSLGIEQFVDQNVFFYFSREEKMAELQLLFFLKFLPPLNHLKKKWKIVKIYAWKLLAPNIRKHFLSQGSGFSFFGCIMNNSITELVISFDFFAAVGIFGIMVGKIQEGW